MGQRHEHFEWLTADEAAEYLGDLWGELITPDTLVNLCRVGGCNAYLMPPAGGLYGECLTPQDAFPRNASWVRFHRMDKITRAPWRGARPWSMRGILCRAHALSDGYQKIISPISLDWVTGATMIIALRGDINMTICPALLPDQAKSSQPTTFYRLNKQCWHTKLSRESFNPLFKTQDIRALADTMNGTATESSVIESLRQALKQEQAANEELKHQHQAELEKLRDEDSKPLDRRERASMERLIFALAKEAGFKLEKLHSDETAIQTAAALLDAKVPTGKGSIVKLLNAAITRAGRDCNEERQAQEK